MHKIKASKWSRVFGCFSRLFRRPEDLANKNSLEVLRPLSDASFNGQCESPVEFTPIETNIDDEPIPGTVTQSIGAENNLLESPRGQVKTVARKKRIRGGCDHFILTIEPEGQQTRLGGHCQFCALLAQKLLSRGVIGLDQAEAAPLYCSDCARQCDACGISGCSKHIHEVGHQDDRAINWCDECIKKAKRAELRNKLLDLISAPFSETILLPDHEDTESSYDQ